MFTGIIEAVGQVRSISATDMWLDVDFSSELKLGQSVACDGVCLTVVDSDEEGFRVEFLEETKKLTSFGQLEEGKSVNVERAMKVTDRFDGHIVQAHVEGIAQLTEVVQEREPDTWMLTVEVSKALMKYMISKGIIILNGIALTIVDLDEQRSQVRVAIIPHTWENTNLSELKEGAIINVETDVIAKYVENLVPSVQ